MSGIVLSSSVRQNLLSLQSTADLLATTQSRLSTGKKVNTALDNPTNYFTAQSLDGRASDISNLLDGINNGVQVLQAANTGITSLSKLIDSAKSIANQALQTTVGYSTKSNISTTIPGATPADLRGTTSYTYATATGNVVTNGTAGGTTPITGTTTLGGISQALTGNAAPDGAGTVASLAVGLTLLGTPSGTTIAANGAPSDGDVMIVDGKTITFRAGAAPAVASVPAGSGKNNNVVTDGNGNSTVYLGTNAVPAANVQDVMDAIDLATGVQKAAIAGGTAVLSLSSGAVASIGGGQLTLTTGTGADLSITGKADFLKALGLTTATGGGNVTVTKPRQTTAATLGSLVQDGSTLNVDGKTITFKNAAVPGSAPTGSTKIGNLVTDGSGNSTVYLQDGTVQDTLNALDLATGAGSVSGTSVVAASGSTLSSVSANGALKLSTGTSANLSIIGTGNALSAF